MYLIPYSRQNTPSPCSKTDHTSPATCASMYVCMCTYVCVSALNTTWCTYGFEREAKGCCLSRKDLLLIRHHYKGIWCNWIENACIIVIIITLKLLSFLAFCQCAYLWPTSSTQSPECDWWCWQAERIIKITLMWWTVKVNRILWIGWDKKQQYLAFWELIGYTVAKLEHFWVNTYVRDCRLCKKMANRYT